MITKRDIEIIETIKEFRILSSGQIQRMFNMTQPKVSKRLDIITNNIKEIKKKRYDPTDNFYNSTYKQILKNENVYYWNRKPTAIVHDLLVNEVYLYLKDRFNLIHFTKEYPITMDNEFVVRADANIVFEYNGAEYEFLLELENNKGFNYFKYNKLFEMDWIPIPIVVVTDRRVYNNNKNIEIIRSRLNLEGLENNIKKWIIYNEFGYKIN